MTPFSLPDYYIFTGKRFVIITPYETDQGMIPPLSLCIRGVDKLINRYIIESEGTCVQKVKPSAEEEIMKKLVMSVIIPVLIGGLFCYIGAAFAEHTGSGKYNNEDLKKYDEPNGPAGKTAPNVSDKISNEKKSEDMTQDQQDWCNRGAPILRTISEAQKELEEVDSLFSENEDTVQAEALRQGKRDSIRNKLKEAESALDALDAEAHEKRVPPGWIRCNFN